MLYGFKAEVIISELDADKQSAMGQEAQIQLLNHAVVVPIMRLKYVFPMKAYLKISVSPDFGGSLVECSIKYARLVNSRSFMYPNLIPK